MSQTDQLSRSPDPAATRPPGPTFDSLLDRWVELTRLEGDGIRCGDWDAVAVVQAAKRDLQPLLELARRSRGDRPSSSELLLRLEQRNLEVLNEVRRLAEGERRRLDQSRRTLGRLQRSYVARSAPVWESCA